MYNTHNKYSAFQWEERLPNKTKREMSCTNGHSLDTIDFNGPFSIPIKLVCDEVTYIFPACELF